MINSCLVGNAHLIGQVNAMIESERLPHSIIIEGDALSGRSTLAFYIAGAITGGGEKNNPDITLTEPNEKGLISVDKAREIRQNAHILPNTYNKRVFIIKGAEKMNIQAQNALLKVIEEPPLHSMFIFICEFSQQLLETVRSRSAILHVNLPNEKQAEKYICENYSYPAEEIQNAVALSSGNIGKALSLLENGAEFYKIAEQFAGADGQIEMERVLYPYFKDIKALRLITENLIKIYHDCLIAKKGGKPHPLSFKSTAEGFSRAYEACRIALEDFGGIVPLFASDGALYSVNLASCIREALGL